MKKFSEVKPGDYLFFVDKKNNDFRGYKIVRVGQIKSVDPDDEYMSFVPEGMEEIDYEVTRDSYNQYMYEDDYCYIFTDNEEARMFQKSLLSNKIKNLMDHRAAVINMHNKNLKEINKQIEELTNKLNS